MEGQEQENTITYTKSDSPFNMKKIVAWGVLLVVIVLIIVLIVVIINTVRRNRDERERNTVPIEQEEIEEDVVLPTEEEEESEEVKPNVGTDMVAFIEEYRNDQAAANTKYVGKEVETYGYIQNMTTSMADGRPFISIIPAKTGNIYTEERIQCFVSSEDVFEGFKTGEGVIVKGIVQTLEFGFIPFDSCSVRK